MNWFKKLFGFGSTKTEDSSFEQRIIRQLDGNLVLAEYLRQAIECHKLKAYKNIIKFCNKYISDMDIDEIYINLDYVAETEEIAKLRKSWKLLGYSSHCDDLDLIEFMSR